MNKNLGVTLLVLILASLNFVVEAAVWAALLHLATSIVRNGVHFDLQTIVSLGAVGFLFRFVVSTAIPKPETSKPET